MQLKAGTPADAFSIGTGGSWQIAGPGLAATHAYLYFDGTTLFVACAPGAIVQLGREAVTTDWKVVPIPAEIRLGGVSLAVAATASAQTPGRSAPAGGADAGQRPAPKQQRPQRQRRPEPAAAPAVQHVPPHSPPRSHSGKEVGQRAPAVAPVAGTLPYDDDDVPTAYQPMPEGFAAEPEGATAIQRGPGLGIEPVPDSERTRVVPPEEKPDRVAQPAQAAKPERPAPPSVSPSSGESATVVQPLEEFLANARAQQSAPQHPIPEMPPAAGAPPAGLMPPAAGAPPGVPQGAVGVYVQPPEPTVPAMGPAGAYAAGLMPGAAPPGWQHPGAGQAPPGQAPPGQAPPRQASAGPAQDLKDKALAAWRDASPVRRVLFFLMPLMIVALVAHVILTARRHRLAAQQLSPPASSSALLASASAPPSSASAPPTVAPPPPETTATAQPPEDAPDAEVEAKLAPGEVTPERKAVDAVAAGDLDTAIKLYSELAKEHPDEPAYAAAAEISEEEEGRQVGHLPEHVLRPKWMLDTKRATATLPVPQTRGLARIV